MSYDGMTAAAGREAAAGWQPTAAGHERVDNVCVIGAGAAGLTAIKNLREYGFGVDCYERETGVGGAWNWRHDRSPVYASTHLISSKPFTQFPDFPMPDSWPDYPHHSQVLAYLERYADHFGLREHIWFGTEVTKVRPAEDGRWDVTISGARGGGVGPHAALRRGGGGQRAQLVAQAAVVRGSARVPRRGDPRVVVQGRGPAARAQGAGRRGRQHRLRHRGRGGPAGGPVLALHAGAATGTRRSTPTAARPTRSTTSCSSLRLPLGLRQWLFQRTLRRTVGDLTRFGLPEPDHRIYETHPIANSQLVYYLGHGAITPVPDVARFTRDGVEFTDGRVVEPDLVILATGYLPRFEFLTPDLLNVDAEGRPRLYLHAFAPAFPTLAVTGLLQPDSGLFSLMHWQAVTIATWLRLRESAPDRAAAFWRRHHNDISARFNPAKVKQSTRHWFEVSHVEYLRAVEGALREMEAAA